ncbi:MAG: T9SS type A sorting domain-containing protein [Aureispira sp.]|nr:T9SS type A sorting domain-containing protein [Aureispira sp.]
MKKLILLPFVLFFSIQSFAQIPIENLVYYTPFTGGDSSDLTLNATFNTNTGATKVLDRFGNTDAAFNFQSAEHLHYSHGNGLSLHTNDFSISVWVKTSNTGRQAVYRIGKYTNTANNNGRIALELNHPSGEGIYANISTQNNNSLVVTHTPSINDGQWHNIIFMRRSQQLHLYLDGVLVNSNLNATAYNVNNTNNADVYIGSTNGTGVFFNGSIDDLAVFNKPLTETEIATIHSATQSFDALDLSAGLISKFDFENGSAIDPLDEAILSASSATLTSDRNAIANNALAFDGTQDCKYMTGGKYNFNQNSNDNHLSVSLWFKSNEGLNRQGLVNVGEYAGTSGDSRLTIELHHPSGDSIRIIQSDQSNNTSVISSNATVSDNQWHHLVYIKQDNINILYLDGQELVYDSKTNRNIDGDKDLVLGGLISSGNNVGYLEGALDEVYIYNRGLHAPEVNELYTTGAFAYQVDVASNLVFDVDFDASADDLTNINSLNTNTNTTTATGYDGNTAYSFNGTSSYIQYKDSSLLDLGTSDFTVSLWLNYTDGATRMIPFTIGKWNNGLATENGKFYIELNTTTGEDITTRYFDDVNAQSSLKTNVTGTLNDGNWHHVVVTRTGSYIYMYVDGVLEKRVNQPTRNITNVNHRYLLLGANAAPSASTFYNGSIDNVKIFKHALNGLDVEALGASIITGTVATKINSKPSLVVYPNPTSAQLTIANVNSNIEEIRIVDLTGKTVKSLITTTNTVNVAELSKGVYILQTKTDKGLFNNTFIKE